MCNYSLVRRFLRNQVILQVVLAKRESKKMYKKIPKNIT